MKFDNSKVNICIPKYIKILNKIEKMKFKKQGKIKYYNIKYPKSSKFTISSIRLCERTII